MRWQWHRQRQAAALILAGIASGGLMSGMIIGAENQGSAATNAPPAAVEASDENEVTIPKSVFVNEPEVGRDPFFPNSPRREPAEPVEEIIDNGKTTAVTPPEKRLELKGITGSKRRLALINHYTFEEGETRDVRTPEGTLTVECVQISPRSVIVRIEGEPGQLELQLPEDL